MDANSRSERIYLNDAQKKRIRQFRLRMGWSQADLAKNAGFSLRIVTSMETGSEPVNRKHLLLTAKTLALALDDLVSEQDDERTEEELPVGLWAWLQEEYVKRNPGKSLGVVIMRGGSFTLLFFIIARFIQYSKLRSAEMDFIEHIIYVSWFLAGSVAALVIGSFSYSTAKLYYSRSWLAILCYGQITILGCLLSYYAWNYFTGDVPMRKPLPYNNTKKR